MRNRGIRRGLIAVALGAMSLLGAACASTGPRFEPPTPDPVAEARLQAISPMANLETRNVTYLGPLPPTVAPLTEQTDALGDIVFIDTNSAVSRFGEERMRQHVVRNVRVCARVEVQSYYLNQLRNYTDAVESYQDQVSDRRDGAIAASSGSMILGAGAAFAQNPVYGGTVTLTSTIPGLANNYAYSMVLDGYDVQVGLSLAQSRFWYNQNDLWLDAMSEWCPAFIDWVTTNGEFVQTSDVTGSHQPTGGPPATN